MPREICEILVRREEEQEAICRFILEDGKLTSEAIAPGSEIAIHNLLGQAMRTGGKRVSSKDQPSAWFHALPENLNGSYARAKMVT